MMYLLNRVVSITFMVISINFLLRSNGVIDYAMSAVLMLFGIYFSIKSSIDKRKNLFETCLDKTNSLVKNILNLVTFISYGILVLSIVHLVKGDEYSLNVLIISLVVTIGGLAGYWGICRKSKERDQNEII